jgi:hypothetical protein
MWPDAISRWIRQRKGIKFCANLGKMCYGGIGNDYTSVRGSKHESYTGSPNSPRTEMARQVKSEVKSVLIIFFYIKGVVHKQFILEGQTVNSEY